MSARKHAGKKEKSSTDYPLLARLIVEASQDEGVSKLLPALYVVATPIGNLGDISLRALCTLALADTVACEDTRVSGGLLARYGIKKTLISYHDHNEERVMPRLLAKIAAGENVALLSDAGMPLIADPGFRLVRACRMKGYSVIVIPGANAALTALAGAGLASDAFYFAGFLPPKPVARQKAVEALTGIDSTLIFYEAPQRLAETLTDLEKILGASRRAAVARELTKLFEETRSGTLDELARFYHDNPAKGEIVILVAPRDRKAAVSDMETIDALLKEQLHLHSLRDAVVGVSEMTGAKKNEVYARALWLRGKSGK